MTRAAAVAAVALPFAALGALAAAVLAGCDKAEEEEDCRSGSCTVVRRDAGPVAPDAAPGRIDAGECRGPGEGCPNGQGCCEGLQCWFLQCVNALVCTHGCAGPDECGDFSGACCKRPGTQTGAAVCYPERFGVCGPDCGCAEGCAIGEDGDGGAPPDASPALDVPSDPPPEPGDSSGDGA